MENAVPERNDLREFIPHELHFRVEPVVRQVAVVRVGEVSGNIRHGPSTRGHGLNFRALGDLAWLGAHARVVERTQCARSADSLVCRTADCQSAEVWNGTHVKVPLSSHVRRTAIRRLRDALHVEEWPKDSTRHTAACYWLALARWTIFECHPVIGWSRSEETELDGTRSVSTTNGASAFAGRERTPMMLKSAITIETHETYQDSPCSPG